MDFQLHTINLFFDQVFQIHQAIGLVIFLIGCFGLYASVLMKRSIVYRLKLGLVYGIAFLAGIGGMIMDPEHYHIVQHTFTVAFMFLITILYWREVKDYMTTEGNHRKSLGRYIDDAPDLIWIKDINNRYTYVNKSFISLMQTNIDEILGKTDQELRKIMLNRNLRYDICSKRDYNDCIQSFNKPKIFLESGYIGDRFIALQIFKGPLYNHDSMDIRNHVGYIGIGRDLTYDVEDHNLMAKLIKEGKVDEAIKIFEEHQNRYKYTGQSANTFFEKNS